jgi:hypothetical protein
VGFGLGHRWCRADLCLQPVARVHGDGLEAEGLLQRGNCVGDNYHPFLLERFLCRAHASLPEHAETQEGVPARWSRQLAAFWRQTGRGPKTFKAGSRTLYRREDVERWLADIDGRTEPSSAGASGWFEKAIHAANPIEPHRTSPWKIASTYALLAIAEALLRDRIQKPTAQGQRPRKPKRR